MAYGAARVEERRKARLRDQPGDIAIVTATKADEGAIRDLWEMFEAEVPEPVGGSDTWEEEAREIGSAVSAGLVLLARSGDRRVGVAWGSPPDRGVAHIELAYVSPGFRRRGLTRALVAELGRRMQAAGAEWITLDVVSGNEPAEATWSRLGFTEIERKLAAPAASVVELGRIAEDFGP